MKISDTIKNIFISIAKKMGLQLEEKKQDGIDYNEKGFNPTAIGATVVAGITLDNSELNIIGDNARAEKLREIADYFTDEIENVAAEVALGTGDCILRPYTDGENIGINVIGNNDFTITESIGNTIKGIIIKLDEYETKRDIFRLFEVQSTKNGVVMIKRFAYKGNNEIPLNETIWNDMTEEEGIIADQLLIGRYKCPTINRDDYNSSAGVPITYGCEEIILNIREKYKQYNEEFERKRAKVFADRSLFWPNKMGGREIANDTFELMTGGVDGGIKNMIQEYSPEIRETDLSSGNNFNLSILELCCGLSRGVFTKPETAFATATEMRNSLQKTYSFVTKFRRKIELGNRMLFNAINIMLNVNNITPIGDYELVHEWSDNYIESTTETFSQLVQAHSIGAVKTEEVTAWVLNMPKEQAEEYVKEIKQEEAVEKEENIIEADGL